MTTTQTTIVRDIYARNGNPVPETASKCWKRVGNGGHRNFQVTLVDHPDSLTRLLDKTF